MSDILFNVEVPQRDNMFSFEGPDGAGKSTQIGNVQRALAGQGIEVVAVASPSSGVIGEFVRHNMSKLAGWERNALFLMDFIHVLKENDDPTKVLLWDRYVDSGYTSNRDMTIPEAVDWLSCLPDATKTFLLDIDPRIVMEQRGESVHDHSSDLEWQNFKRARYEEVTKMFPDRIMIIDATQPKEDITEVIVNEILANIIK